jgi:hypothetical protein
VVEGERRRVQRQAVDAEAVPAELVVPAPAVAGVADDGVAGMLEVAADLVEPPGPRVGLAERVARLPLRRGDRHGGQPAVGGLRRHPRAPLAAGIGGSISPVPDGVLVDAQVEAELPIAARDVAAEGGGRRRAGVQEHPATDLPVPRQTQAGHQVQDV